MLTAERTRYRNRLHGVLATQGVRLRLRPSFLAQLATLTRPDGARLPAGVVARLTLQWALLQTVEQALRQARAAQRTPVAAAATPAAVRTQRLRAVEGDSGAVGGGAGDRSSSPATCAIGERSARSAAWCRCRIRAATRAMTRGLVGPVSNTSAGSRWKSRGAWVRWQPETALTRWYQQRFGPGGGRLRRIGIVALARKLLIALWRYSEYGIVPAGAAVRT